MFNTHGIDRIACWKEFRNSIEISSDPLQDCVTFWTHAPFVNQYLNPYNSELWPDPWQLIINQKYDNLAIVLGMLYTLKLTDRFTNSLFEILMSNHQDKKEFYLVIDNLHILNYNYAEIVNVADIDLTSVTVLFTVTALTKY